MPAPVRSRSSFTRDAVISAILYSSGDVIGPVPGTRQI